MPSIEAAALSDRQKAIAERIGAPRDGLVDGPFRAWLLARPDLAEAMNELMEVLRFRGALDKRLYEVAVLCVARFWRSDFQWSAHVPLALRFGVSSTTVKAIYEGRDLSEAASDERLVHRCADALLVDKRMSDDLFRELHAMLGQRCLMELVTVIGQYSLADMVTNAFHIGSIDGCSYWH